MTDNCWCLACDKCDSFPEVQMSRCSPGFDNRKAPLGLVYLTAPKPSTDESLSTFSPLVSPSRAVYFPLTTGLHSKSHFIVSRDCGLLPRPVCWLPVAINAQYLCWGLSAWSYFIRCCVLSCLPYIKFIWQTSLSCASLRALCISFTPPVHLPSLPAGKRVVIDIGPHPSSPLKSRDPIYLGENADWLSPRPCRSEFACF